MNLLTDFLGIGDAIGQAFRTFFGLIAATIYSLIEYIYHVFELLARAEIISSDFIQQIYSKVGTILSLFMLFKLSFSLIQSLIDPNKLTDEKSGYGKIIFRSVIAIVLLGTTPAIFREAYNIQNLVVGSDESTNVLYKLVVGGTTNGSLSTIGRDLSSTLYFQFFTDNEEPKFEEGMTDTIYENDKEYDDRFKNNDFATLKEAVKNSNMSFYDTVDYLAIKDTTSNEYVIEVSWLALIASGIFVLYMIAIYCIQVAIRVAQLAYLQLVAPIPILSYISDPDGSFKKWYNQCFKTYLDLFIRLTVIYFSMSIISSILNELNNTPGILYESTGLGGESWITQALVVILIIIGLLLFAKKVPELLKDLFPGFGDGMFSFGLKPPKELKNIGGFAAGAVAGGSVGLIGGGVKGLVGGFAKGAISGAKGTKLSEIASNRASRNKINRQSMREGSTFHGRNVERLRNTFGLDSGVERIDRIIEANNQRIEEINNSEIFQRKGRNDAIIGARKAIYDDAVSDLTRDGNSSIESMRVKEARDRIDEIRKNVGHFDSTLMRTATLADVSAAQANYDSILNTEVEGWVNTHIAAHDRESIERNIQIITDNGGGTPTNFAGINASRDTARHDNATIAADIAAGEHEKNVRNAENSRLNREKRIPQADQNAIKRN